SALVSSADNMAGNLCDGSHGSAGPTRPPDDLTQTWSSKLTLSSGILVHRARCAVQLSPDAISDVPLCEPDLFKSDGVSLSRPNSVVSIKTLVELLSRL